MTKLLHCSEPAAHRFARLCATVVLTSILLTCCANPVTPFPPTTPTPTPTATATPEPTHVPPTETPPPTITPTPDPAAPYWPGEDWRTSTPEQQGMDSALLAQMLETIARDRIQLHSLIVVRHGTIVTEAYFSVYRQGIHHNLYSATKSFTSALVGIAIAEGAIAGVQERLVDLLPEVDTLTSDPRWEAVTLEDLLTMRSGIDWPESAVSYRSSRNILMQLLTYRNWVEFILRRPMVAEPGSRFNYSTADSHLLSVILDRATGTDARTFARTHLFDPIGASGGVWRGDPQGNTFGGGGIWLTPRDMARFGYLYLNRGRWGDRQVVPAEWVEASTTAQTPACCVAPYYGYQWWVLGNGGYAAVGYRGQRIFVYPNLDLVVVITAGVADSSPEVMVNSFIIPAIRSSDPLPENPEAAARLEALMGD